MSAAADARSEPSQGERPGKLDVRVLVARLGYLARAVVYGIIGGVAVRAAFGPGGDVTGTTGAVQSLLEGPAGALLVAVLGAGLLCFGMWRFVQAVQDTDGRGDDVGGLAVRAGMLGSGISHAALSVVAAQTLLAGSSSDGASWGSWLLRQDFGAWLIGGLGVAVAIAGLSQLYKAWTRSFCDHLTLDGSSSLLVDVCRFGIAARGVVFGIIGVSLTVAGVRYDPSRVRGIAEALDVVRAQPYGAWLFGATALGLLAFAVYCLVEAVYRRVETR